MSAYHYIYRRLSTAEYERVRQLAERDGLAMAAFVRECVNDRLVEESEDAPLVEQPKRGRPLRMAKADLRPCPSTR